MFSFVALEYILKKESMLESQFVNYFHIKNNKIKISFYLIKDLMWFCGDDLVASP
jgi:hypothetical protein